MGEADTHDSQDASPDEDADEQRRKLLLAMTCSVGGVGLLAAAYPFIASLKPSAAAVAAGAPVNFDPGPLAPGELRTVAWRGRPVWVMRRTPEMVSALQQPNDVLADPMSTRSEQPADCRNATRSIRPDLFVCVGVCTHLGCSPGVHLGDADFNASMHTQGGFLCPCHGSRFDLAGRVAKNMPAPINLEIPPYAFSPDGKIVIGSDTG